MDGPSPLIGGDSEALFNTAIEDCLAHAPNEEMRGLVLRSLMIVLAQYLARDEGRVSTAQFLREAAKGYER